MSMIHDEDAKFLNFVVYSGYADYKTSILKQNAHCVRSLIHTKVFL